MFQWTHVRKSDLRRHFWEEAQPVVWVFRLVWPNDIISWNEVAVKGSYLIKINAPVSLLSPVVEDVFSYLSFQGNQVEPLKDGFIWFTHLSVVPGNHLALSR